MWPVKRPKLDAGETFSICIKRVKDSGMRQRLMAIRPDIEAAEIDYIEKAENCKLYLIPRMEMVGAVPGGELVKTYDARMARNGQPGRLIYDQIKLLPEGNRCPLCDQRNVSTLDHFLPKTVYPVFAVTPTNLVGVCAECNRAKSALAPTNAAATLLHPYFDEVSNQQWLFARVEKMVPVAVTFHVISVDKWDDVLNARLAYQFKLLGLAELYSSQAAREVADIRQNLQQHFKDGGADAVRTELECQRQSRKANRVNSWQTATYMALTESDWFCEGGFDEF